MTEDGPLPWLVMRQDDNGNRYVVRRVSTREAAEQLIARLESGGHKQLYWVEPGSGAPGQ